MRRLAGLTAKFAGWLSRRLGRGGGTTLPGVILLRLRPNAIAELSAALNAGVVVCSATNGKTTTTRLIVAAADALGHTVATNAAGSNLERGVATALLEAPTNADLGVFEVDEAALTPVADRISPGVIVLMNLFRDQLDRYGELETLIERWEAIVQAAQCAPKPPILVANADDPNIAEIARSYPDVVWFGVDAADHALPTRLHAADATTCRRCGSPIVHDVVLLGHLGHWRCSNCDAQRPQPDVSAVEAHLHDDGQDLQVDIDEERVALSSALPGIHNTYNLAAAAAAAKAISNLSQRALDLPRLAAALSSTAPAFGRGERIEVGEKSVRLLLAKNPTGVNQNIRTLLAGGENVHVLAMLNDRTADGRDVSWIWDVDWEPIIGRTASLTLAGDRAYDLALRFRYAGAEMATITIEPHTEHALDKALANTDNGDTLHVLPTYTAMLDLRQVLAHRGLVTDFWVPS